MLYIVPTPIGNLEDITLRALRILKEADIILAEDTRTSGKLLKHYGVETRLSAYHAHNEHRVLERIIEQLKADKTIALISDAGTPAISDPGFLLVRECVREKITVECLPGATAFVPALVNSALPCNRFSFEGFLPQKKGRKTWLESLKEEKRTMVFYESPYRLLKTLKQFVDYFGEERMASVSRELSKLHEENARGTLAELVEHFGQKTKIKGEIVIVLEGKN
ncbi:MAG: 16S rRNA (cytidine(1402)-2'-O)-methyltransferase [Chitinophagales bacterium]